MDWAAAQEDELYLIMRDAGLDPAEYELAAVKNMLAVSWPSASALAGMIIRYRPGRSYHGYQLLHRVSRKKYAESEADSRDEALTAVRRWARWFT